ncbi:hypothetical protein IC608_11565 [Devosia sp. PTR5]|uniref:Uncharacterized protein n=1 Tax=Devosia oryzisoli TaxID=2774138 RepID=A0A927IT26_9HYPH|nr:hypothetical protein [Devosia oryzisoli]MBD8066109.1 hypothetical protein [Devosia oryzisoli]
MEKQREVQFMSSEFGIPPYRAAALVASSEAEAAALATYELARQRNESAYGDVPLPESPEDHAVPENGGLQKTVIGRGERFGQCRT